MKINLEIFVLLTVFQLDFSSLFKLHLSESHSFLKKSLRNAVDVKLIHHGYIDGTGDSKLCQVRQRGIDFQTQEMELIGETSFKESDFDPSLPINIRQFVAMVHIKDGILAITSDLFMFMLQFNYDDIQDQKKEVEGLWYNSDDERPEFARLLWNSDLGSLLNNKIDKEELPQLVYSNTMDNLFILFKNSAHVISVSQLLKNRQNATVHQIYGWVARSERGWSKSEKSLLFTVVGEDGLDIYLQGSIGLIFIKQLNAQFLWPNVTEQKSLVVKDFAITPCLSNYRESYECHMLHLMDANRGIVIVQVILKNENTLIVNVLMSGVGASDGGVSIDTIDGLTFLASYNLYTQWVVMEISVNYETSSWDIVRQYKQRTKVLDVRMNNEIAVIQGLNHHQFIFFGQNPSYLTNSIIKPIMETYGSMRDFDFFRISHMSSSKISEYIQNGDNQQIFDSFFFGVTKFKMFITKYQVVSPDILCFTENPNTLQKKYMFTVFYNTTSCPQNISVTAPNDCNLSIDFDLEIIQSLLFTDKVFLVFSVMISFAVFFLFLIAGLIFLYRKHIGVSLQLQQQIQQFDKDAGTSQNKIEMVDNSQIDVSMKI